VVPGAAWVSDRVSHRFGSIRSQLSKLGAEDEEADDINTPPAIAAPLDAEAPPTADMLLTCQQATALMWLVVLKRFLKDAFGLKDARCRGFKISARSHEKAAQVSYVCALRIVPYAPAPDNAHLCACLPLFAWQRVAAVSLMALPTPCPSLLSPDTPPSTIAELRPLIVAFERCLDGDAVDFATNVRSPRGTLACPMHAPPRLPDPTHLACACVLAAHTQVVDPRPESPKSRAVDVLNE